MRFLSSRLANGAVYEAGILDELPNPGYLDTLVRPQQELLATRSAEEAAIKSPPLGSAGIEPFSNWARQPLKGTKGNTVDRLCQGSFFASDYQGPNFEFQGPPIPELPPSTSPPAHWFQNDFGTAPMEISEADVNNLLNNLLEVMSPPQVEETTEPPQTFH